MVSEIVSNQAMFGVKSADNLVIKLIVTYAHLYFEIAMLRVWNLPALITIVIERLLMERLSPVQND